MSVELFTVDVRVGWLQPPVSLLCQAIELEGEKLLWLDGMSEETPVLVPLAGVRGITYRGDLRTFLTERAEALREVLAASQDGESHSPTILARAVQYLDIGGCTARQAIEMAVKQGLDVLDRDAVDATNFVQERARVRSTMAA